MLRNFQKLKKEESVQGKLNKNIVYNKIHQYFIRFIKLHFIKKNTFKI